MRGGTLVIGQDCTRPCGNMTQGTCMIFGTARQLLPTFQKVGIEEAVYQGRDSPWMSIVEISPTGEKAGCS